MQYITQLKCGHNLPKDKEYMVEVELKLSLCLIKHHAMKIY
jgi:hypothetical protein